MSPNVIRDLLFSYLRTIVPIGVATVVGVLTENFGPIINEDTSTQITGALYALAAVLYYVIARALETYVSPKFSFLVGDFRNGDTAPVYPAKTETTVVPPAAPGQP